MRFKKSCETPKNVIIPDLDNDLNVIDPPIKGILYLRIESKH